MDKFTKSIKKKYLERRINRDVEQWPPCHSNKLIKLELLEQAKGKGYSSSSLQDVENDMEGRHTPMAYSVEDGMEEGHTLMAYSDLFKVDSGQTPVRKVLVEGDAGIGKTTLCTAASEDWAKGKLFQQFELVLLLPLRYKEIASAGSLSELLTLLHPSASIRDSVVSYLEDEEGEKVLIIADGWDELGESEQREDSFLFSLFFKQFPFLSVILTSRPSASVLFHRLSCIDRFVMVRGFSYEDIVHYIQSEFPSDYDKADRLELELMNNPLIESICSIPLNCAIVCHLWRTLEEALPSTMTGLYTKIVLNILLRNVQKIKAFSHIRELSDFDDLPDSLRNSWLLLCEFAFHTVTKARDQIVFSQQELLECFPSDLALDENVLCFGLLQCTETIFETGRKTAYHFLHLTFQEYLAALFLAKQPTDMQLQVFQLVSSANNFDHFSVFLAFYFGITNTEPGRFIHQLIDSVSTTTTLSQYIHHYTIPLCHFAFESTSEEVTDAVISSLSVNYTTSLSNNVRYSHNIMFSELPSNAHDCAAMIYVLARVQDNNEIVIKFEDAGVTEGQIKTLTDILSSRGGGLRVTNLNLAHNELTDECVSDLFSRAPASFSNSLVVLSLQGNDIGVESMKSIATTLGTSKENSISELAVLDMSDNPLGVSGLQAVISLIDSGSLAHLVDLNLQDTDSNGEVIGSLLKTLAMKCTSLQSLDISDNCVQDDYSSVMSAVSKLGSSHRLKCIGLKRSNINDNALNVLVQENADHLTSSCCHFELLDLKGNDIHAIGISHLATAKNIEINTLSLTDNPLGVQGAQAICELLSSNKYKQLSMLKLSRCELASLPTTDSNDLDQTMMKSVGEQLSVLPQNTTIAVLHLDGNIFSELGIYILAGFTRLCSCLVFLSSCECGITSDDMGQLLNFLSQNSASCKLLRQWTLNHNDIDDKGVYALVRRTFAVSPFGMAINLWH